MILNLVAGCQSPRAIAFEDDRSLVVEGCA
jgi:hypothetical protein